MMGTCMLINCKTARCILLLTLAFAWAQPVAAQQFSLYGTGTLWDSFENPSQKAFELDISRQFASNFLFLNSGANANFSGPGKAAVKNSILYENGLSYTPLDVDSRQFNRFNVSTNNYLLMFRLLKTVKYQRELGFSWQTRAETQGILHNQALIIFKTRTDSSLNGVMQYLDRKGKDQLSTTDIEAQSYHQIGFTYKEQYNKRFSYGVKLSYLSGIAQNSLKVSSAELIPGTNTFNVDGDLKSSYNYHDIDRGYITPGFKNPGMSLSLSGNFKLKNGVYVLTNLKDIGFIRWSKNSYRNNESIDINPLGDSNDQLDYIQNSLVKQHYTTLINGKAEALVNKEIGFFKPSLLISKSLFNHSGDIVLINSYNYKALNLSVSGAYNLNEYYQFGAQVMLKSPNVEFFIGSDNILQSYTSTVLLTQNEESRKENFNEGIAGAAAYIGFALKFGRIVSHPQNENYIPGINHRMPGTGILHKLFGNRD